MAKYYGDKMSNSVANPSAQKGLYDKGFANMPSEKVMKEFPKAAYGAAERYNDTMQGQDMLAKDNNKKMMGNQGRRD